MMQRLNQKMTPEGKIKQKVKDLCKKHGAYYHMPVQNGMGTPTLDFTICAKGKFIGVETKAPGKKATPRQLLTMRDMEKAGGVALLVDGGDSLITLEFLLQNPTFVSGILRDDIEA